MNQQVRHLSSRDVAGLLTTELARTGLEQSLICHALGDYEQPLKPYMYPLGRDRSDEGGRFITMMGRLGPPVGCAGVKHIAGFPRNLERGLPRASGLIILNDVATGMPLAVMDCAGISAARTGAVAALCYQHLGPRQPGFVALCGAGPIAAATIAALSDLPDPPIGYRLFDRDGARAERLAAELAGPGSITAPVRAVDEVRAGVAGAEVVITATTAREPYIRDEWLTDCRLAVALSFEDFEPRVLLSSKLVVDDWDQCCREEKALHRLVLAGRLRRDQLHAELGAIVSGRRVGREHADERFYANLMGMAIEDLAVAWMVFQRAEARGIGTLLDL